MWIVSRIHQEYAGRENEPPVNTKRGEEDAGGSPGEEDMGCGACTDSTPAIVPTLTLRTSQSLQQVTPASCYSLIVHCHSPASLKCCINSKISIDREISYFVTHGRLYAKHVGGSA